MARGKAIEMLLVDGTPGAMTTVRINGSTSKIITAKRSEIPKLKSRDEANRNGVYFLLGEDPNCIENTWCYIGKTEDLGLRLVDHQQNKPEWERLVFCYSDDESYNEGHWGYLEHRLIQIANDVGRCSLPDNKQTPRTRKLSEAQVVAVDNLLDEVKILLPLVGVNVLRSAQAISPKNSHTENSFSVVSAPADEPAESSPVFNLHAPAKGVDAQLQVVDGEFFLLKNSRLLSVWEWNEEGKSDSTKKSYAALAAKHQALIDDGALHVDGPVGTLVRDVVMPALSTAAGVCIGSTMNGRISWKTSDGITYKEWETTHGI